MTHPHFKRGQIRSLIVACHEGKQGSVAFRKLYDARVDLATLLARHNPRFDKARFFREIEDGPGTAELFE